MLIPSRPRLSRPAPEPVSDYLEGGASAKRSVIRLLKAELRKRDMEDSIAFIVEFDAWKYAGDSLRKAFLHELQRQLNEELKRRDVREKIAVDVRHVAKEYEEKKPEASFMACVKAWGRDNIGLLLFLLLWVLVLVLGAVPRLRLLALVGGPVGPIGLILVEVSRNLRRQMVQKIIEYPPQDPVEFESKFDEMMTRLQDIWRRRCKHTTNERAGPTVLIVFDNLDRCPPDTAYESLTTIKTFLSANTQFNCCYVVPCDDEALKCHLKEKVKDTPPEEFLRKFFATTIRILDPPEEEIVALLERLLEKENVAPDDFQKAAVNVVASSSLRNPRRIKKYINALASAWSLARERERAGLLKLSPGDMELLARLVMIDQEWPSAYAEILRRPDYLPVLEEGNRPSTEQRDTLPGPGRAEELFPEELLRFAKATRSLGSRDMHKMLRLIEVGDVSSAFVNALDSRDTTVVTRRFAEIGSDQEKAQGLLRGIRDHVKLLQKTQAYLLLANDLCTLARMLEVVPNNLRAGLASLIVTHLGSEPESLKHVAIDDASPVFAALDVYVADQSRNRHVEGVAVRFIDGFVANPELRDSLLEVFVKHPNALSERDAGGVVTAFQKDFNAGKIGKVLELATKASQIEVFAVSMAENLIPNVVEKLDVSLSSENRAKLEFFLKPAIKKGVSPDSKRRLLDKLTQVLQNVPSWDHGKDDGLSYVEAMDDEDFLERQAAGALCKRIKLLCQVAASHQALQPAVERRALIQRLRLAHIADDDSEQREAVERTADFIKRASGDETATLTSRVIGLELDQVHFDAIYSSIEASMLQAAAPDQKKLLWSLLQQLAQKCQANSIQRTAVKMLTGGKELDIEIVLEAIHGLAK